MKLVFISDTHGMLDKLVIPDGDILIHSGDALNAGTFLELTSFASHLNALPHKHKIFVPGNHDRVFEQSFTLARQVFNDSVHVLLDSSVTIEGINFYGSPWQPEFFNWAFNLPRDGVKLREKWEAIPLNTNVLITHCPPYGILDTIKPGGANLGCEELTKVLPKLSLKAHSFGHIHGSYGVLQQNGTMFINAASCNEKYKLVNSPITLVI